jgi:hypothetical protein
MAYSQPDLKSVKSGENGKGSAESHPAVGIDNKRPSEEQVSRGIKRKVIDDESDGSDDEDSPPVVTGKSRKVIVFGSTDEDEDSSDEECPIMAVPENEKEDDEEEEADSASEEGSPELWLNDGEELGPRVLFLEQKNKELQEESFGALELASKYKNRIKEQEKELAGIRNRMSKIKDTAYKNGLEESGKKLERNEIEWKKRMEKAMANFQVVTKANNELNDEIGQLKLKVAASANSSEEIKKLGREKKQMEVQSKVNDEVYKQMKKNADFYKVKYTEICDRLRVSEKRVDDLKKNKFTPTPVLKSRLEEREKDVVKLSNTVTKYQKQEIVLKEEVAKAVRSANSEKKQREEYEANYVILLRNNEKLKTGILVAETLNYSLKSKTKTVEVADASVGTPLEIKLPAPPAIDYTHRFDEILAKLDTSKDQIIDKIKENEIEEEIEEEEEAAVAADPDIITKFCSISDLVPKESIISVLLWNGKNNKLEWYRGYISVVYKNGKALVNFFKAYSENIDVTDKNKATRYSTAKEHNWKIECI